jgi:hypothetical protein
MQFLLKELKETYPREHGQADSISLSPERLVILRKELAD